MVSGFYEDLEIEFVWKATFPRKEEWLSESSIRIKILLFSTFHFLVSISVSFSEEIEKNIEKGNKIIRSMRKSIINF